MSVSDLTITYTTAQLKYLLWLPTVTRIKPDSISWHSVLHRVELCIPQLRFSCTGLWVWTAGLCFCSLLLKQPIILSTHPSRPAQRTLCPSDFQVSASGLQGALFPFSLALENLECQNPAFISWYTPNPCLRCVFPINIQTPVSEALEYS